MRCDCESEACETQKIHRAGACQEKPSNKVRYFGLVENLCTNCQKTINPIDRLAGDFTVLERLVS